MAPAAPRSIRRSKIGRRRARCKAMELASVVPEEVSTAGAHPRKLPNGVWFTTSTCGHFLPASPPKIDRRGEVRGHIGERGERGKSRVKAMTCGDGEKIAARPPGRLGLGSVLGLGHVGWHPLPWLISKMVLHVSLSPVWGGIPFFLSFENGLVGTLLLLSP